MKPCFNKEKSITWTTKTVSPPNRVPARASNTAKGQSLAALSSKTAKLPSDMWLWAAFASIGTSLFFQITGDEKKANFVGHWAPTFLALGIYNKLVKLHGSEGI